MLLEMPYVLHFVYAARWQYLFRFMVVLPPRLCFPGSCAALTIFH